MKLSRLNIGTVLFISLLLLSCENTRTTETQTKSESIDMPVAEKSEAAIGDLVWTTSNLNIDTFRNGDTIPEAKSDEEWEKAGMKGKPAWCYYDNNNMNGKTRGRLYNWFAINDPRGLVPSGWHIPSEGEWMKSAETLGGVGAAGPKMKKDSIWKKPGTNQSGFAAVPGGFRDGSGFIAGFEDSGFWWCSPEGDKGVVKFCRLSDNNDTIFVFDGDKTAGFSVRCVKD